MCDHPPETWKGNLHALHCDEKNNIVHILKRHHNNASENHLLGLHFTPNFQKERIDPLRDVQPLLQTLGHVRQVLQSDAAEPMARPWSVYECLSGVLVHVPIPFRPADLRYEHIDQRKCTGAWGNSDPIFPHVLGLGEIAEHDLGVANGL